jgi:hypothetical protein
MEQMDGAIKITDKPPPVGGFAITWGARERELRCAAIETGFWCTGMHLDMAGLYAKSSFNTPEGMAEVLRYKAPKAAADIVLSGQIPPSKYKQHEEDVSWDGIVLPLQVPHDRSVIYVGNQDHFWTFVEGAAMKYRKSLFIKVHPMTSGNDLVRATNIATRYGSTVGKTNHSVLDRCKFVLTYNSTFAIDAMVRGVRVAQFAPGYFYKTGAVTYTAGEYPDEVPDTRDVAYRLCDFLIWRYCFVFDQPPEMWVSLLTTFAGSLQRFPLPEALSYGANLQHVKKQWSFYF